MIYSNLPLELIFPEEYGPPPHVRSGDIVNERHHDYDWHDSVFGRMYPADMWFIMPPYFR